MADGDGAALVETLDEVCRAVAATAGAALYLDDGEGALQLAATSGPGGAGQTGFLERLRQHRRERDGRTLALGIAGSRPGLLVLARRGGSDFTQQDRSVARLYARHLADDHAVTASHIARSGWMRQLEAIQRIAARLTRLASVEEVGAAICTETRQVINHDEAYLLVGDDFGGFRVVAATGGSDDSVRVLALPASGLAADAMERAISSGLPILEPELPRLEGRPGAHSLLVAPLQYEGQVRGLICLVARGAHKFDDDDVRLIQILSDQAAVAIENARLLSGRDQLVQELASLLEISQAAGAAADENELARLIARRMRVATRTDAALVTRWDEGSTELQVICRDGAAGASRAMDAADSPVRRQVLRVGRPQVIQADGTPGPEADQLRQAGARTLLLFPLTAGGRTVGMIELLSIDEMRQLTDGEIRACEAMANLAATGLEKVRLVEQLRNAADMDMVTAVHNHRYLQERLGQEVARSARSHSPLAVLMLDLDKFKPINDRHGHADGDRVLHTIGATIKAQVRINDVVARYGGDEFVVLMPDTPDGLAEKVARRVVRSIMRRRHQLSDGSTVTVAVSAGLACYPSDGRTPAALLQAADAAMYSAKGNGGRRIERSNSRPELDSLPAAAPATG